MRKLASLFVAVAVAALGLSSYAKASPPASGGVKGLVDRGPITPVVRPGVKNTAPVVGATIIAKDSTGKEVARTRSDKGGHYTLPLAPGKYTIVGPRSGITPRPFTRQVEVKGLMWVNVKIHLDTGIRTAVQPQGVPLGVVHKINMDRNTQLPKQLTVKVGEYITFVSTVPPGLPPGTRIYNSFKVTASDANPVALIKQGAQRINPPALIGQRAGKGTLEIFYKLHPHDKKVYSSTIDITVLP